MSLGKNDEVFYISDCNCKDRATKWEGALLNNKNIGCGVNVLVFLELLNESYGKSMIPHLDLGKGTSVQQVVDHLQQWATVPLGVTTFPLTTQGEVKVILDIIQHGLSKGKTEKKSGNACTIIKLNRAAGVGHTVILSVEDTGKLYTVDPQVSTFRERNDSKMFASWSGPGGFMSMDVIIAKMPKTSKTSKTSVKGPSPFLDSPDESIDMPPKKGLTPNMMVQDILAQAEDAPPMVAANPEDLLPYGKVYAILCHGNLRYEPLDHEPSAALRAGLAEDKHKVYYDFDCIKVPPNVILGTLIRVGQSLSPPEWKGGIQGKELGELKRMDVKALKWVVRDRYNAQKGDIDLALSSLNPKANLIRIATRLSSPTLRVRAGMVHEVLSGKFQFEQWGGVKGKAYSFPNYSLSRDTGKWSTGGIYQKMGKGRDTKSIRTVLDMQKGDQEDVFAFNSHTKYIVPNKASTDLRQAIQGIIEDAGKTKDMIYIYCSFCLGSISPNSYDKINKCISTHSLGQVPEVKGKGKGKGKASLRKKASLKKASRKKASRKKASLRKRKKKSTRSKR